MSGWRNITDDFGSLYQVSCQSCGVIWTASMASMVDHPLVKPDCWCVSSICSVVAECVRGERVRTLFQVLTEMRWCNYYMPSSIPCPCIMIQWDLPSIQHGTLNNILPYTVMYLLQYLDYNAHNLPLNWWSTVGLHIIHKYIFVSQTSFCSAIM